LDAWISAVAHKLGVNHDDVAGLSQHELKKLILRFTTEESNGSERAHHDRSDRSSSGARQ
jgi:hypothetical protein